jgi:hypothetical protein
MVTRASPSGEWVAVSGGSYVCNNEVHVLRLNNATGQHEVRKRGRER